MATPKKNKNKPKLNLTVRDEQRNKLEQMASLENRSVSNLIEVMADERWKRLAEQQGVAYAKTVAEAMNLKLDMDNPADREKLRRAILDVVAARKMRSLGAKGKSVNRRLILSALTASAALCAMSATTRAAQIFVTNFQTGTIGEYTTSGETVDPALISGLSLPQGIAASGGNLFVTSLNLEHSTGRIGEYTTSGATVNPALITTLGGPMEIAVSGDNLFVSISNVTSESARIGKFTTSGATVNDDLIPGLSIPLGVAVSGDDLFVVDWGNGKIGKYTTSGAIVNASLVSGLISPIDVAVSGGNLFVTDSVTGTIGEYNATTGATVDADLVSGLNGPGGIAVLGGNLFVTNSQTGTIGEYTISGETVNASLISGLNQPTDIVVVSASVADASSPWTLLLLALTATFGLKALLRRSA